MYIYYLKQRLQLSTILKSGRSSSVSFHLLGICGMQAKLLVFIESVAFGDVLGIAFLVSKASEAVRGKSFLGLRTAIFKSKSAGLGLRVLGYVK